MTKAERPVSLPSYPPSLRVVTMPSDINHHGVIFGGWLLAQIDAACFIPAATRACGYVASVAINAMTFESPVHSGDLVSIYTNIVRVGRTSMTIHVEVYTQRNVEKPEYHRVATGEWVFVAVDENHRPRPIPQESSAK
ncbi:MAG: acyl-CoA thioesterase [Burkholderiales bacterium]|jgi:acyl-CoA thioesterase YciA|nr:acyl-CoA thioesterase [Burkholderiales bacterium]